VRKALCILILGIPTLVVAPFFIWGYPRGHDIAFHVNTWADFIHSWKEGTVFPGWAAWANFGFGEPRFIFYPPLSRFLAAAISLAFPWRTVPGVFIWITTGIAGLSMYRLARLVVPAEAALKTGVLFAANPYLLLVVYQRSAFAELLAIAVFPLVILCLLRLPARGWQGVIPLAWAIGAVWLSNVPASIVATYCVILVCLVLAAIHREMRVLLQGAVSMAIAGALAAFYILPVIYERQWVNISVLLSRSSLPAVNYLFSSDPDVGLRFNQAVSVAAFAQLLLMAISLVRSGKKHSSDLSRVFLVLAAGSFFLMLPLSQPLWSLLPALEFVQFPWRWMFVFNVAFPFFIGEALQSRKNAWTLIMILAMFTGFSASRSRWVTAAADRAEESINLRQGYVGVKEYSPAGSHIEALQPGAPEVSLASSAIHIEQWSGERKAFTVDAASAGTASLRLLAYPGWSAEVNGKSTPLLVDPTAGHAMLALPAGHSRVEIDFRQTPDRYYGNVISILAASALILYGLRQRSQFKQVQRRCYTPPT
jgi:hypothetical protein